MSSGNPILQEKTFEKYRTLSADDTMTVDGVINKSLILMFLLLATAIYTWTQAFAGNESFVQTAVWVGAIGGLICVLVSAFVPTTSPFMAPAYAGLEGLAIGGISSLLEMRYPGIVVQAVGVTFAVFAVMLIGYRTRVFRVTPGFRKGVMAATLGIFLFYLVNIGLNYFANIRLPMIHESGWMGIGFSLLVSGLAAMNLLLDFDTIEQGAARGAPKFMEWQASLGLLVTLVWLYLEILRLLSKSRD